MEPSLTADPVQKRLLLAAMVTGVAYGALCRLVFGSKSARDVFGVMTVAFLFLVPCALGFLSVYLGESRRPWSWWLKLIFPWVPALIALAGALALAWEGLICIFLWLPLFMIMSSLGGALAGLARWLLRRRGGGVRGAVLAFSLVLPFLVAPVERSLGPPPAERRGVATEIDIAADPATVWRNIERVPAIRPEEQRFRLFHAIGFPRPIEAELIGEGVGAVRHATFEGGVLFVETITLWEPGRRLAFSIHADPDSIPQRTLDEHVTVGGELFDVLSGEYVIEPLAPGRVRLHLTSTHRLSTRFNFYSGFWTDLILRDVQQSILEILKRRCEAQVAAG